MMAPREARLTRHKQSPLVTRQNRTKFKEYKVSITKSQTDNIGSIFKGNHFTIPKYQRKYSWTDSETKALWNDINESIGNGMNHFVGTLCFKENKNIGLTTDTEYEVIDGQQRLTTFFLMLYVLLEKISDGDVRVIPSLSYF